MPSTNRRRKTVSRRSQSTTVVFRNVSGPELLDRFRDFVLKNHNVQEGLRNVKSAHTMTKFASKYGFPLSERSVRSAMQMVGGGLSVDELGGLMLGAPCWCNKSVVNSKSCKK